MIVFTDIRTKELTAMIDNKENIDRKLDAAIDNAVYKLTNRDENGRIIVALDEAVKGFYNSLYSSFGIISDKEMQDKLKAYIPVVLFVVEDGYYIYYNETYTDAEGYINMAGIRTEKCPFYYEDDDFIYGFTLGATINIYDKKGLLGNASDDQVLYRLDYKDIKTKDEYQALRLNRPDSFLLESEAFEAVRKSSIINNIEASMAYYTSHHNKIAAKYGITYDFALPAINDGEWAPFLDDACMFVVFQGYPYGGSTGDVYNRVASAGARVIKKDILYITEKDWYRLYHKENCEELDITDNILSKRAYYDIESCVKEGAYACPVCFAESNSAVYPPVITP